MRRLLGWALQHPGRVLSLAAFVLVVFVFTIASTASSGMSIASLRQSVGTTLTLMLAIDSPAKMLENRSVFIISFGWLVCLMGWLVLPLLVGVLVDISISRGESYSKLRLMFRDLGRSANLNEEALKKFTDEMMKKAERMVNGRENG
jgi:apolipoprotein N-acyltransferase